MNAPALVLGPPVRDGKPYAEIAHTARSVAAFVAIDRALAAEGFAVPEILAQDLDAGLPADRPSRLGRRSRRRRPADRGALRRRRRTAGRAPHATHGRADIAAAPGVVHDVPPFDRDAMLIEVDLLVDWYLPCMTGEPPSTTRARGVSRRLERGRLAGWNRPRQTLVLRDFHSPNIIWRDDRPGHDRLGIIDFQDALMGPAAYDVASLAMDARVTVPPEIEASTVAAYVAARQRAGAFDEAAFAEAYAIMAAQRNSKILGIFVRLDRRDGKPAYLKHLPRIRDYLAARSPTRRSPSCGPSIGNTG